MTKEGKAIYDKVYRRENRDKINWDKGVWRKTKPGRYSQQKENARRRGIVWLFSYTEWEEFWGGDYLERSLSGLMMCRYKDQGPYSSGNCYKGTPSQNVQDAWDKRKEVIRGRACWSL